MSTKSKSIASKKSFDQDERLQKVSKLRLLLNRPELGALGGAILVFIFFGMVIALESYFSNWNLLWSLKHSSKAMMRSLSSDIIAIGFKLLVNSLPHNCFANSNVCCAE